jgi:hypothetical protein
MTLASVVMILARPVSAANFLGFNSGPFYSIPGTFGSPTQGAVLEVVFDEPVVFDTFIGIASSDPTVLIINSGGVTIPTGQSTAVVNVISLALGSVTLTASYNATMATAVVSVVSEIPISPPLGIECLPGITGLTWPTNAVGFLLETNSSPTAAGGWGLFASNYSILNTNYVVTNACDSPAMFFRLRKPLYP